jgi:hypothetical protein
VATNKFRYLVRKFRPANAESTLNGPPAKQELMALLDG